MRTKYIKCGGVGIYFLLQGNVIVYIGSTTNFPRRISAHYDKRFDRIRFIECEDFKHQEIRWMRKFKPKYNTQTMNKEWREILIETGHLEPSNTKFTNY